MAGRTSLRAIALPSLITTITQSSSIRRSCPEYDLEAAQLAKLDLVSRNEFDVQAALLKRTQAALVAMELRLKDLETKIGAA